MTKHNCLSWEARNIKIIIGLVKSLRPRQWIKNLLLFAGAIFTLDQGHAISVWLTAFSAFAVFCALSGATYIINDILDVNCDRQHPAKRKRPIAGSELPIPLALITAIILLAGSIAAAYLINLLFFALAIVYVIISLSYSVCLKHLVILDLLAISGGFLVRAAAGAAAISVTISPWLLICTTLISIFLALAKRRSELVLLECGSACHRRTLSLYTVPMIDQMLSISAAATLITYCLYTFAPISKTGHAHPYMIATVPYVIYGLFRYLFLVHNKNTGSNPELVLIEDKPLLINVILYVITAALAIKL